MMKWFKQLDSILRGDATLMSSLREERFDIPVVGLGVVAVLLAIVSGACVGSFGVLHPEGNGPIQILASAVKMPMLFFFTLLITFPSLYVFNALVGSRLSGMNVLRLLVAMLGVMLAVLASLGPIIVFFSLSTQSYVFMKLLNVAACGVGGFLGLAFLLRTLHRLVLAQAWRDTPQPAAVPAPAPEIEIEPLTRAPETVKGGELPAALTDAPVTRTDNDDPRGGLELVGEQTDRRARVVFRIWLVVFGLVGAQMSWVLRPFLGAPGLEFQWFRPREGNFFETVLSAIGQLLGVG